MAVRTHVALLRAINVGGHNRIGMAPLRSFFADLGFDDPRTLLQSGNVVFGGRSRAGLEAFLEAEARARLSLDIDFLVRSAPELTDILRANPFPAEARTDPGHLLVMFLKSAPASAAVAALAASIRGREVIHAQGRELYMVYPDGVGRSKLTGTRIEKALGTRGTARNWNTLVKLTAMTSA
jgi:uncharacterized protein (DUF1697 family)